MYNGSFVQKHRFYFEQEKLLDSWIFPTKVGRSFEIWTFINVQK